MNSARWAHIKASKNSAQPRTEEMQNKSQDDDDQTQDDKPPREGAEPGEDTAHQNEEGRCHEQSEQEHRSIPESGRLIVSRAIGREEGAAEYEDRSQSTDASARRAREELQGSPSSRHRHQRTIVSEHEAKKLSIDYRTMALQNTSVICPMCCCSAQLKEQPRSTRSLSTRV